MDKAINGASRLSGYGYALLAASLWALLGPVSRLCFAGGVEPLEAAFWRALIGGLAFGAHALYQGQMNVQPRHGLIFCLFGVIGSGLLFSAYLVAVKESGAALAVVLLYTAPVWVALFSRALFHEAITRAKAIALTVALTGTILVCFSGGSLGRAPSLWGISCGLAAGFMYAMHYPFNTWWQSRYSTATLYTFMLLSGAVVIFPFISINVTKPFLSWVGLMVLGLCCTYGAFWAYGQGLRRISPVRAAVLSNLEPVLGTLLAWVWWHESFSPLGWAGCVLVLFAVFLLTLDTKEEKNP